MVQHLNETGEGWSQGLTRLAIRMATGTGKTTVMACLIAWYAVNQRREHRAISGGLARNVDRIVVICPGRTIKARLSGLDPRAEGNLYDEWQLVPQKLGHRLSRVPVEILNWEKLQPKTGIDWTGVEVKSGGEWLSRTEALDIAGGKETHAIKETHGQMWSRLLGSSKARSKERVVVLNDEGHHCWERKDGVQRKGVWMEALHALKEHEDYQLAQAIDLSATPIFIDPANTRVPDSEDSSKTARLKESSLVPWIVSEFALMEAMESGLVKIPQLPHRDDGSPDESVFRNLFEANKGQKLSTNEGMELVQRGADILYQDYEETFATWEKTKGFQVGHPVLIVVANNKVNAWALFKMLGGWRGSDGVTYKSNFDLLSNVPRSGADESECGMRTILVLSKSNDPEKAEHEQISGGALGLREVKGGDAREEELQEVLQTVAQPEKAGAEVRCVVSVGMLTEGWDCQRVTHILGYRKFGSQLLCEQTMGRALRRRDYENLEEVAKRGTDGKGIEARFPAEYATVFGVPFARMMEGGAEPQPMPPPDEKHEVYPVKERVEEYRIWLPDFQGYTMSAPGLQLALDQTKVRGPELSQGQTNISTEIKRVETQGVLGEERQLSHVKGERPGNGLWLLAADLVRALSEKTEAEGEEEAIGRLRRGVLFSGCLRVVREWLNHNAVPLHESELEDGGVRDAAQSDILNAITIDNQPARKIGVASKENDLFRSAGDWERFETGLKDIAELQHSELNIAACHSKLEVRIAEALDALGPVKAFVRNHGRERIEIPYKYKGAWKRYVPDFFVRCRQHNGKTLHIVLEGKGMPDEQSKKKGWWTDHWWIPCANDAGEEHGQIWIRREIGPNDDVGSAIQSAIREVQA